MFGKPQMRALFLSTLASLLLGCTAGHFRVQQVAGGVPGDPPGKVEGFRYFMPKPFLLVTNMTVPPMPAEKSSSNEAKQQSDKEQAGSVLTVQLVWLPDPKQQYAVSVQGGRTGTFKGTLQMTNGWMLVGVNQEFDTKTVETLDALTASLKTILTASGSKGIRADRSPVMKPFLYLFEVDLEKRQLVQVKSDDLQKALQNLGE